MPQQDRLGQGWAEQMVGSAGHSLTLCPGRATDSAVKGGKRLPGSTRKGTGASKGAKALWDTHGADEANPVHPAAPGSQA